MDREEPIVEVPRPEIQEDSDARIYRRQFA